MGSASFLEGKDGHEDGEKQQGTVAKHGPSGKRLWLGKTSAIDVEVQQIGTQNHGEESANDQSDQCGPDAKADANYKEQTNGNFHDGKPLREEQNSPGRQHLIGIDLQGK
jgi:hypothetical protein